MVRRRKCQKEHVAGLPRLTSFCLALTASLAVCKTFVGTLHLPRPHSRWSAVPQQVAAVLPEGTPSGNFSSTGATARVHSAEAEAEYEDLLGMMLRGDGLQDFGAIVADWAANPEAAPQLAGARAAFANDATGAADFMKQLLSPLLDAPKMEEAEVAEKVDGLREVILAEDFAPMRRSLIDAMFQKRVKEGASLQIQGLQKAQELNGRVGVVRKKRKEELEQFQEDDRVILQVAGYGRIAIPIAKLTFPRYSVGDVVTMHAEFEGSDSFLKGRAGIVSKLTEEELELGRTTRGGLCIVDVLKDVKFAFEGDEPEDRIMLWPETLRPRPPVVGDVVELVGLTSKPELNGAKGSIAEATEAESKRLSDGQVVLEIQGKKAKRLLVQASNTKLVTIAAAAKRKGFR
mmetsp:Transcript_13141/g.29909  ORF Transcript_13141/g.29909 Transcript_13141/m.29909 type:complete len:403 (-) Transcript_13141:36-1244(-)